MIKLEKYEVMGWEYAIRGMRNPMNSWEKSDSKSYCLDCKDYDFCEVTECLHRNMTLFVGPNDLDLAMRLRDAGTDHRKFMRMITVYVDVTAPLYWWKEFDTYKVGTVANSCSTMHKIHEKEFTLKDFSCEHLDNDSLNLLERTINVLNNKREHYVDYDNIAKYGLHNRSKKDIWWQMIQLLPSSHNQKRTVMLNYEVLANIYKSRKTHKLDEWRDFCSWIENLPYSEIITGYLEE